MFVGGGVIGRLVGSFSKAISVSSSISSPGLPGLIIHLLAAILMVILIHELGHLVGGRIAGYSFFMLTVGPFKWVREQDKVRMRWNTSLNTFGGLALMVPTLSESESRRMGYFILGGPVASFGLFLFAMLGVFLVHLTQFSSFFVIHAGFFLMIVAAMSLVIGISALIPFSSRGFASDGKQFLDLLRGGKYAERRLLMLALASQSFHGKRPREWDASLMVRLLDLAEYRKDQIAVGVHGMAFYHYLDLGEVDRAVAELDRALELIDAYPPALRQGLWLERAYFQARYGNDPQAAAESLKKGAGGFVEAHTRARSQAAVALANGDLEAAMAAVDRGLSRIDRSMDRGGAIAEKEWLLELQEQLLESEIKGSNGNAKGKNS